MKAIRNMLLFILILAVIAGAAATLGAAYFQQIQRSTIGPGDPFANINQVERLYFQHYLYQNRELLYGPASPNGEAVEFTISSGETGNTIAQRLQTEGLLQDQEIFVSYARYKGLDSKFEAGTFLIEPGLSTAALAQILTDARAREVVLTILEGWRIEEMARYLNNLQPAEIDGNEFLRLAQLEEQLDLSPYPYLTNLPEWATLEGYLFPDTYTLPLDATARDLIIEMLNNFDSRITPDLRQAYGSQNITLREAVIMASIIEREAVLDREKPVMASVFFNRIAAGMGFEADPTVQYAVGYVAETDSWWKSPLTVADLQINSFYNTYLYQGFIPGPIAAPGLASMEAVANPANSDFIYFVVDCEAAEPFSHEFNVTYADHLAKVESCR
ncbi:MAG: endolytic transglycosylase MltG [Chloroflexota bacterium]